MSVLEEMSTKIFRLEDSCWAEIALAIPTAHTGLVPLLASRGCLDQSLQSTISRHNHCNETLESEHAKLDLCVKNKLVLCKVVDKWYRPMDCIPSSTFISLMNVPLSSTFIIKK